MSDYKLDPDFAALSPRDRAGIEALSGIGLHHAPEEGNPAAEPEDSEAFYHPEQAEADTPWQPDWVPIDTYTDGDMVVLDDGQHQILGMRKMGMWLELLDGDEIPKPDYLPTLWASAPDQVMYDMMYR